MSKQRYNARSRSNSTARGWGELSLVGIGVVRLAWTAKGLVLLALPDTSLARFESELGALGFELPEKITVPERYARTLREYARGADVDPTALPVDLRGTPFQLKVWRALRKIPRGHVRSYAGIAGDIKVPRGMRAVGSANGRNPVPIAVPCHRVIERGGGLGGYSGGLGIKQKLLKLEGVQVQAGRVLPGQLELW